MVDSQKTYMFFGTGITNISGAPLYYQRKKRYLERNGWHVRIFTFVEGTAALPELRMYEEDILPELKFLPVFYSPQKQDDILNRLQKHIPLSSEYIIESNRPLIAPWAELLAERLNAKHILFCLDEHPGRYGADFLKFIWFKYNRKEATTFYRAILRELLGRKRSDTSIMPIRLSVTPTKSVDLVADVPFDDPAIQQGRINVLSIGRLDKPYVLPIMREFAEYAITNTDMQFNLIVVGHDDTVESQLHEMFETVLNVNPVCLGELHPIPEKLLQCIDVAIATAGSASLCRRFAICTISVDTVDMQPIGIMGYNAKSNTFRLKYEPPIPLSELLNMALREKVAPSNYQRPAQFGSDEDYSSHFNFIEQSAQEKEYYHFTASVRDLVVRIVGVIIGLENCNRLFKFFHRSKKK